MPGKVERANAEPHAEYEYKKLQGNIRMPPADHEYTYPQGIYCLLHSRLYLKVAKFLIVKKERRVNASKKMSADPFRVAHDRGFCEAVCDRKVRNKSRHF